MPYKRRRTTKRKTTKRKTTRKNTKKPIGYTKTKAGYKLVYGSKTRPKLGTGTYKTKNKLLAKARKELS